MNAMTTRTTATRSVPVPPSGAWPDTGTRTSRAGFAAARTTFEPILRASQAGGLCALMDELRRLGALGPKRASELGKLPRRAGATLAAQ